MNKEISERWVAALRSGEYEQGRGWLNRDGKFCCLGVLCDLAVKEDITSCRPSEVRDGVIAYGLDDSVAVLTEEVLDWAGMSTVTGALLGSKLALAEMNDSGDFSFDGIAYVIELNYDVL